MPYTPQTWADGAAGGTPITATRLNFMETGINDADSRITVVEASNADQPKGLLARASTSTDQTGITTVADLTGLSVTFTPTATRYIKLHAHVRLRALTNSVTGLRGLFKEGGTELGQWADDVTASLIAAQEHLFEGSCTIVSPSVASHTYKLTLERVTGTGTLEVEASTPVGGAWIEAYDMGGV
jgi:hypothetical protein